MWEIELTDLAKKNIKALESAVQAKVIGFLHKLENVPDPRQMGHAMKGSRMGTYWTYRFMKDYRIIVKILDREIIIVIVSVGNRKNVYKNLDRIL